MTAPTTPTTPPEDIDADIDAIVEREGLPPVGRRRGKSMAVTIGGAVLIVLVIVALAIMLTGGKDKKKAALKEEGLTRMAPLPVPERPIRLAAAPVAAPAPAQDTRPLTAQQSAVAPAVAATPAAPQGPHQVSWQERKMHGGSASSAVAMGMAMPAAPADAAEGSLQHVAATGADTDLGARLKTTSMRGSSASLLGNLDYIITMGTPLDCISDTKIVSTLSGLATCHLDKDVWSANNRVKLLEKGTRFVGEYTGSVKMGEARLFMAFSRAQTEHGVVININSPGTDALGASGLEGWVDNHWRQKIGAALGVAIVQDVAAIAVASKGGRGGNGGQNNLVLGNTATSGEKMSEEILKSTIPIAPTITINEGDHIKVMLATDLYFDKVYGLEMGTR